MTEQKNPAPGWRSSEFVLSIAAVITGIVLSLGLPEDSIVMQVAGLAATVLTALGYTVSRHRFKAKAVTSGQ